MRATASSVYSFFSAIRPWYGPLTIAALQVDTRVVGQGMSVGVTPYAVTPDGAVNVTPGIDGGVLARSAISCVVGETLSRNRLPRSVLSSSRPDCAP